VTACVASQVCGNDPAIMAAAAAKIESFCKEDLFGIDAIEINLGCVASRLMG
jgi:tRNA-dihydrouridine synthase